MKYIGENALGHILNQASGMKTDLTQAARAYYEEIVVPIDGTEVESKCINPAGMLEPNNSLVFLMGMFFINGVQSSFSTLPSIVTGAYTLFNLSSTPAADSIKRTVQIKVNTDKAITYKHIAGTNSALGPTTVRVRMIALNVSYMQGTYKYDKVLANNSWTQIAEASKNGCANMLWNIGDEIEVELTGKYAQTLTLQIADFYHDDLADGSGKAGITFICKECMKEPLAMGPPFDRNNPDDIGKSWSGSDMYKTVMPAILECLPNDLKDKIKSIIKETGFGVLSKPGCETSINKLFLLSESEVMGNRDITVSNGYDGEMYSIFTDNENRLKGYWWLRSPVIGGYVCVLYNGNPTQNGPDTLYGVCFGFCV